MEVSFSGPNAGPTLPYMRSFMAVADGDENDEDEDDEEDEEEEEEVEIGPAAAVRAGGSRLRGKE